MPVFGATLYIPLRRVKFIAGEDLGLMYGPMESIGGRLEKLYE